MIRFHFMALSDGWVRIMDRWGGEFMFVSGLQWMTPDDVLAVFLKTASNHGYLPEVAKKMVADFYAEERT